MYPVAPNSIDKCDVGPPVACVQVSRVGRVGRFSRSSRVNRVSRVSRVSTSSPQGCPVSLDVLERLGI
jgi:hypothetical protein